MPPPKGPLWKYFHEGPKQNSSHHRAYCYACIKSNQPADSVINVDEDNNRDLMSQQQWFQAALDLTKTSYLGEKSAMAGHLKECVHVGKDAKKDAEREVPSKSKKRKRQEGKTGETEEKDIENLEKKARTRKLDNTAAKILKQTELKVFKGITVPFSDDQQKTILAQFLRATISANLSYRWVEDVEMIKLFLMFRSAACDVMPSKKVLASTLLDKAVDKVEDALVKLFKGLYSTLSTDGWKCNSRNAIAGIHLAHATKSYLVDVIRTNAWKKDGKSMCAAFIAMIDSAEKQYQTLIVAFICDNDGGSQRGRKDLVSQRPWLLVFPCLAHQMQLILGDYFKENKAAAQVGEDAVGLIGWVNNHDKVREILDRVQLERTGKVLTCIVANLTRWTTHLLAFLRLLELKDPFLFSALVHRDEIVAAQIGAEANAKKKKALENDANNHCDLMATHTFWQSIQEVVDDIEPICYATNIAQSDNVWLDQFVLALAGLFLHFSEHRDKKVADGMKKRLEKRWKDLDQASFVITLVLNPYERLSRFGDGAAMNVFVLNKTVIDLYRQVHSRPPVKPCTSQEEEEHQEKMKRKSREVSEAFLSYLGERGAFKPFKDHETRESFTSIHGENPIPFWESMQSDAMCAELADFAILLFDICPNQGGVELTFSDFSVKTTKRRNRLGVEKLGKMSKVGANIRAENMRNGLTVARAKRSNHDEDAVSSLLHVPHYADLLDAGDSDVAELDDEESNDSRSSKDRKSVLVKSRAGWRRELARWQEDDEDSDSEFDTTEAAQPWCVMTLEKLFSGQAKCPVTTTSQPRKRLDEEARLMELLAAEYSDEPPDDGELEGSGDDFEG